MHPPACCASGEGTLYFAGGLYRIMGVAALRVRDERVSVSLRRGFSRARPRSTTHEGTCLESRPRAGSYVARRITERPSRRPVLSSNAAAGRIKEAPPVAASFFFSGMDSAMTSSLP
jgi:hypothetical protein